MPARRRWSVDEDARLRAAVAEIGAQKWKTIAEHVGTRSNVQCRQRWEKLGTEKRHTGAWTAEEDSALITSYHSQQTEFSGAQANWTAVAANVLGRSALQCKHRWNMQLDPSLNKNKFSADEMVKMEELSATMGRNWAKIAAHLPGRTPNMVRNHLQKKGRRRQKEGAQTAGCVQPRSESMANLSTSPKKKRLKPGSPSQMAEGFEIDIEQLLDDIEGVNSQEQDDSALSMLWERALDGLLIPLDEVDNHKALGRIQALAHTAQSTADSHTLSWAQLLQELHCADFTLKHQFALIFKGGFAHYIDPSAGENASKPSASTSLAPAFALCKRCLGLGVGDGGSDSDSKLQALGLLVGSELLCAQPLVGADSGMLALRFAEQARQKVQQMSATNLGANSVQSKRASAKSGAANAEELCLEAMADGALAQAYVALAVRASDLAIHHRSSSSRKGALLEQQSLQYCDFSLQHGCRCLNICSSQSRTQKGFKRLSCVASLSNFVAHCTRAAVHERMHAYAGRGKGTAISAMPAQVVRLLRTEEAEMCRQDALSMALSIKFESLVAVCAMATVLAPTRSDLETRKHANYLTVKSSLQQQLGRNLRGSEKELLRHVLQEVANMLHVAADGAAAAAAATSEISPTTRNLAADIHMRSSPSFATHTEKGSRLEMDSDDDEAVERMLRLSDSFSKKLDSMLESKVPYVPAYVRGATGGREGGRMKEVQIQNLEASLSRFSDLFSDMNIGAGSPQARQSQRPSASSSSSRLPSPRLSVPSQGSRASLRSRGDFSSASLESELGIEWSNFPGNWSSPRSTGSVESSSDSMKELLARAGKELFQQFDQDDDGDVMTGSPTQRTSASASFGF